MAVTDLQFILNAKDNATRVINGVRSNNAEAAKDAGKQWKKAGLIIGAAFTAVGAAGLKLVSGARKMNSELGQTALTLGISTDEMRNLALATTDVTFPLDSVIKTYDILTRAGMRNTEEMQKAAFAFDVLGDATGSSADVMADLLIPALKVFGEKIPQNIEDLDKFTWLAKNTAVEMSDFAGVMNYVAAEAGNLDLTSDDLIATLAVLESRGITGSAATRLFRTAVSQATKEGITLNDVLGISRDELGGFREKMDGAIGITQNYADVANTQYGIMDIVKQKWSELTLRAGSFLTPLEPILAGMTALGPVLTFASTGMGLKAIKTTIATAAMIAHGVAVAAATIAIGAATSAQWLWNAAMSANPIGLIILAVMALIAAIVLIIKNWDTVKRKTIEIWDSIVGFFRGVWEKITGIFTTAWDGIVGVVKGSVNSIIGLINSIISAAESMVNFLGRAINSIPKFNIPDWVPLIGGKTFGLPTIPTVTLPHIPLLDTGGLVEGPGMFAVGRGVKEVVREARAGVTIGSVNIYANSRAVGREAGKGFIEEMQRRGIRLSGSYA